MGKTTLLKLLYREELPDAGTLGVSRQTWDFLAAALDVKPDRRPSDLSSVAAWTN